jgi:hypothetical protein
MFKKCMCFKYGYLPIPAADPQRRYQSTNGSRLLHGFGVIGQKLRWPNQCECLNISAFGKAAGLRLQSAS